MYVYVCMCAEVKVTCLLWLLCSLVFETGLFPEPGIWLDLTDLASDPQGFPHVHLPNTWLFQTWCLNVFQTSSEWERPLLGPGLVALRQLRRFLSGGSSPWGHGCGSLKLHTTPGSLSLLPASSSTHDSFPLLQSHPTKTISYRIDNRKPKQASIREQNRKVTKTHG